MVADFVVSPGSGVREDVREEIQVELTLDPLLSYSNAEKTFPIAISYSERYLLRHGLPGQ